MKKEEYDYCRCGKMKLRTSKTCRECFTRNKRRNISRIKSIKSLKKIKKGCGKIINWSGTKYKCGQMEDLKHSDHIILCSECSGRENYEK